MSKRHATSAAMGRHFRLAEPVSEPAVCESAAGKSAGPDGIRGFICPQAIVFGLLLSLALVFGWRVARTGAAQLTQPLPWILTLVMAVVLGLLTSIIFRWLDRTRSATRPKFGFPHAWLIASVAMAALWTPVFLAFFPGMFTYDTLSQLGMTFGGNGLDQWHPVLHTLFLWATFGLGLHVFGTNVAAGATYTVAQMAIMAMALGHVARAVGDLTRSRAAYVASVLWLGLCPVVSILVVSCTKDVLFTAAAVNLIVELVYVSRSLAAGERPKNPQVAGLFACAFLSLALRNNMLYAMVVLEAVLLVLGLVRLRQSRAILGIVAVLVAATAAEAVFAGPVCAALGVTNTKHEAEMLSVPEQQLARAATLGVLDPDQQAVVDQFLPTWPTYEPYKSDAVKNFANVGYLEQNRQQVRDTYLQVGREFPGIYADAFMNNTLAAWYPLADGKLGEPYLQLGVFRYEWWDGWGVGERYVEQVSVLPGLRDAMTVAVDNCVWQGIPVVNLLMGKGAQVWTAIFACLYLTRTRRDRPRAAFLLLLIMYWGTLLFGPVILTRYLFVLFAAQPLVFGLAFSSDAGREDVR